LSTKDLLTLDHLPDIIESGVTSIKIEGRMKKPEYVASVVAKYREAIDRYYEQKPYVLSAAALKDLKKVFNREFTKGYLFGETNANITNISTPNHQGIEIGEVIRRSDEALYIRLSDDLHVGDGIRIRSVHEAGLTVTKMFVSGNAVEHATSGSIIMIYLDNRVSPKDKVLKTSDIQQTKDLVSTITSDARKVLIDGVFTARLGEKPELKVMTKGFEVTSIGDEPVEKAQKAPMTEDMIRKQLNKLGDTPFIFSHLELNCDEGLFINIKDLNEIRRKAVFLLGEKLTSEVDRVDLPMRYEHLRNPQPPYLGPAGIVAFVDNREAMEAALEAGCEEVIFQGSDRNLPDEVIPAFNRVVTSYPKDLPPKVFINENGGMMLPTNVIVGPYCNIVNTQALSLLARLGIREVYLSPEMSKARMKEMMNSLPEEKMTRVIAKNMHNDAKFCQMCHLHHYELIDRLGNALPIIGDSQCNMRILNPKRLNLIDYVGEMADMGIKKLAMIFTTESKEEIMEAIKAFTKALAKEKTDFRDVNDTYGHYLKGIE
jgi:putative protease